MRRTQMAYAPAVAARLLACPREWLAQQLAGAGPITRPVSEWLGTGPKGRLLPLRRVRILYITHYQEAARAVGAWSAGEHVALWSDVSDASSGTAVLVSLAAHDPRWRPSSSSGAGA